MIRLRPLSRFWFFGPGKPGITPIGRYAFMLAWLQNSLFLSRWINKHGASGQIRRATLPERALGSGLLVRRILFTDNSRLYSPRHSRVSQFLIIEEPMLPHFQTAQRSNEPARQPGRPAKLIGLRLHLDLEKRSPSANIIAIGVY